ncbi:MAG: hypothetical protein IIV16_02055 [Alistipes sp.]|nr:hypothetical protein [Alistipes sp.]
MALQNLINRNKTLLKWSYYFATLLLLAFSMIVLYYAYTNITLRLRYWACIGALVVGYIFVAAIVTFLLKGTKRYRFHTVALQVIPLLLALFTLCVVPQRKSRVVGSNTPNRYERTFNDLQKVQKRAALANGLQPFASRDDFEKQRDKLCRANKLVKISSNSKYIVRELTHSVPYVVPKVARLLDDIATAFQRGANSDVRFSVTSVLRTVEDVANLQTGNANASSNSCHCNATTIDISYADMGQSGSDRRMALAKAISELRKEGRCYVKFERNQLCYHITVR